MNSKSTIRKERSVHKNFRLPADLARWIEEQAEREDVYATTVVVYYLEEARRRQQRRNRKKQD